MHEGNRASIYGVWWAPRLLTMAIAGVTLIHHCPQEPSGCGAT